LFLSIGYVSYCGVSEKYSQRLAISNFYQFRKLPAIGNGQSDSIARQTREKEEPEDGEEKRERDVEERLRQQQPQVLRYCRCCSSFKPPRSHHCNICKRYTSSLYTTPLTLSTSLRCILRMEHHSFWINNCIGHYNQKYYLLFLFYGTVSGIGAALLFTWVIINVFFEVHLRAPLADTTHATQPSH